MSRIVSVGALVAALLFPVALAAQTRGSDACPVLTADLYINTSDSIRAAGDVAKLQRFLVLKGYLASDNVTGFFGPFTEEAVQDYQREKGIAYSGSGYGQVGPITKAAIAAECDTPATAPAYSSGTQTAAPSASAPVQGAVATFSSLDSSTISNVNPAGGAPVIDRAALANFANTLTLSGNAPGRSCLMVYVHDMNGRLMFGSDGVPVSGGAWSYRGTALAPGTYTAYADTGCNLSFLNHLDVVRFTIGSSASQPACTITLPQGLMETGRPYTMSWTSSNIATPWLYKDTDGIGSDGSAVAAWGTKTYTEPARVTGATFKIYAGQRQFVLAQPICTGMVFLTPPGSGVFIEAPSPAKCEFEDYSGQKFNFTLTAAQRNVNSCKELCAGARDSSVYQYDQAKCRFFDGLNTTETVMPAIPQNRSCTYAGGTIAHRDAKTFYLRSVIPSNAGRVCSQESEVRTCINGTLYGSYEAVDCRVGESAPQTFSMVSQNPWTSSTGSQASTGSAIAGVSTQPDSVLSVSACYPWNTTNNCAVMGNTSLFITGAQWPNQAGVYWSATNIAENSCTMDGPNGYNVHPWSTGAVNTSPGWGTGELAVGTHEYKLTCKDLRGATVSKSLYITVMAGSAGGKDAQASPDRIKLVASALSAMESALKSIIEALR